MDVSSLVAMLAVLAVGGYWYTSLSALEIARAAGARACREAGLQFLDDTVAGIAWSLRRDERGRRVVQRSYRFEFSESGDTRREGGVVLMGDRVISVTLEPYRILDETV
ncbi:MAG: DUF3301 domain-containing protein [Gallionella sp.]|nr:DUF3301 domain-containing protein [Gallionella sp.]